MIWLNECPEDLNIPHPDHTFPWTLHTIQNSPFQSMLEPRILKSALHTRQCIPVLGPSVRVEQPVAGPPNRAPALRTVRLLHGLAALYEQ